MQFNKTISGIIQHCIRTLYNTVCNELIGREGERERVGLFPALTGYLKVHSACLLTFLLVCYKYYYQKPSIDAFFIKKKNTQGIFCKTNFSFNSNSTIWRLVLFCYFYFFLLLFLPVAHVFIFLYNFDYRCWELPLVLLA